MPVGTGLIHASFNLVILILAWHGQAPVFGHRAAAGAACPGRAAGRGPVLVSRRMGVFIKDMNQIVPLFVQMSLFLSPVFYPISAVPTYLRPLYLYNPLGAVIEAYRAVILQLPCRGLNGWPRWPLAVLPAYWVIFSSNTAVTNLPMRSEDIAVSVRNVTKTYRLFAHPGDRIKQFLSFGIRRYHQSFNALSDVSLDILRRDRWDHRPERVR